MSMLLFEQLRKQQGIILHLGDGLGILRVKVKKIVLGKDFYQHEKNFPGCDDMLVKVISCTNQTLYRELSNATNISIHGYWRKNKRNEAYVHGGVLKQKTVLAMFYTYDNEDYQVRPFLKKVLLRQK